MNRKILSTIVVLVMSGLFSAYAQETETGVASVAVTPQSEGKYNAYKTTWLKNRFKDTWFITFGSGVQTILGEDDSKADLSRRITYAPSLTIGKYFSPIWGMRLQLTGGSLHGFNDGMDGDYRKWNNGSKHYMGEGYINDPALAWYYGNAPTAPHKGFNTWDPQWYSLGFSVDNPDPAKRIMYNGQDKTYRWQGADRREIYMQHVRYAAVSLNFTFDFLTLVGNYNPRRAFDITPFAGVSVAHVFPHLGNDVYNTVGANGGLNAKIRLSDNFDLNFEGNVTLYPDDFDGHRGGENPFDITSQALAGITYKIGKTTWDVANPVNYEMVQDLNEKINSLRVELDQQVANLASAEGVTKVVHDTIYAKKSIKFLPDAVFFRIDKSVIDAAEWSKIEKAVNYLNDNQDANVIVTGYADKKTAYPAYNLRLSERRAKTVAKVLTTKYGISPLRVSINWEGDRVQPFEVNEWNRVVIFVIE